MNYSPVLLTVDELALFLKVSNHTIYYWVSRKEIPVLKIGKHLRFDKDKVLAHFQSKADGEQGSPCLTMPGLLHSKPWSLKTRSEHCSALEKGMSHGNR